MSEVNVEIVRSVYEAGGDRESACPRRSRHRGRRNPANRLV